MNVIHSISSRVLTLTLLVSLLSGCGNPKQETYKKSFSEVVSSLQADFQSTKKRIKANPKAIEKHAVALESLLLRIKVESEVFDEFSTDDLDALKKQARSLKKTLAPNDNEGKKQFEALKTKITDQIGTLSDLATAPKQFKDRVTEIEKLMSDAPSGVVSKYAAEMADLRSKLDLAKQMKTRFEILVKKAEKMASIGFFEIANGVLDSFNVVPEFKESEFAKLIDKKKSDFVQQKIDYDKKKSSEDALPWNTLLRNGTGLDKFNIEPSNAFLPKSRYLEVEHEDDEETGKPATLTLPGTTWKNFVFELEFRVIRLGMELRVRDDGAKHEAIPLSKDLYPGLGNTRLQIRVEGKKMQILSFTTFTTTTRELTVESSGSIGLFFQPNAKVRITSCRIKELTN